VTAAAAVDNALGRIARLNDQYRAFATVDAEGARAAAVTADDARAEGRSLGLLHGMMVAIKDSIDTADLPTSCGSKLFAGRRPNADAPVVTRLKRAGAIIMGKAALMELCFGIRSTDMVAGQVRNPWNPAHVPGGSSGGSAAAVALDLCQGALGTDTGGSVRIPAGFCGVTGLRPTYGRVPNRGALAVSASFDTIGPIAWSVDEVARMLAVMAGFDAEDPCSVPSTLDTSILDTDGDVSGLRIGLPRNFYFDDVDPEVAAAVREIADALRREGAQIVDVAVPQADQAHRHATAIILADACAVHEDALTHGRADFSPQLYERMVQGRAIDGVTYAKAVRFREEWRRMMREMFGHIDILLIPASPFAAPPIEDGIHLEAATRAATRFTYGGGLAGIPGLSVPCGFTAGGLPIGALMEAAWWNEAALVRAGRAWQRLTHWHRRRPLLA
jgi:aspartyl-tRNA(Asn)/glutamyl-tRNA(Gln) amidotransferase subunit A